MVPAVSKVSPNKGIEISFGRNEDRDEDFRDSESLG
jgi:hypothetical protein